MPKNYENQITVEKILALSMPETEYIDVKAVASVDLVNPESRKFMAGELRAKRALLVAPRIFGYIDPIGRLMLSQYDPDYKIGMPAPHRIALALCRQNGWKLGVPLILARFLLGLSERPITIDSFPYDQPTPRNYTRAGVEFVPLTAEIGRLSPAGQALALALPVHASEQTLREIGLLAVRGPLGKPDLFVGLSRDRNFGFLNERELIVAEVIKSNFDSSEILLRAPVEWVPPAENTKTPFLEDWWVLHTPYDNSLCLAAHQLSNHPHLTAGNLAYSSPLIWLDERLGWARTVSRIYRLGRKLK
ncbi:MAG: hypothetical protein B7Z71_00500 [Acidocella sp. 21-58-7]|nr:MAG: hypothetical protein B7Z71_00500 [Acidocella sp. 21-58-7]HQT65799.1 hypothetical protein [Acidocella sp.]